MLSEDLRDPALSPPPSRPPRRLRAWAFVVGLVSAGAAAYAHVMESGLAFVLVGCGLTLVTALVAALARA